MWPILHRRRARRLSGFAIPCFIHNGSRHLTTSGVYSNGAIDAWHSLDLALFKRKLREGWVVPDAPAGTDLSVFNLGGARVERAEWNGSPEAFWKETIGALRQLNPNLENLIDLKGDDVEIRNGVRHVKLGSLDGQPWKSAPDGHEILGDSVPVFARLEGTWRLLPLFVFADESCRLGSDGEFESLESAIAKLEAGELVTSVPDGKWIEIEGLGRFVGENGYWQVKQSARITEIHDKLRVLQGEQSCIVQCARLLQDYRENPDESKREPLRQAYERVPEHKRRLCGCGDIHSKNSPIHRAIYGDET